MTAFFQRYVTDDVALFVHVLLISIAVFSTYVVAKGIIWEHGPLEVRHVADKLVVWGVIAEAVCTVLLFVFDEGISATQKARIDAQQETIIALLRVAPRIVSGSEQKRIRDKLKPFGPLVVAIGSTPPLTHTLDIESVESQMADLFRSAGWRSNAPGTAWNVENDRPSGIWISVREGEIGAAAAADILVSELNAIDIVSHKDPKPLSPPKPPKPPLPPPSPPAGLPLPEFRARMSLRESAVVQLQIWQDIPDIRVIVGTKP